MNTTAASSARRTAGRTSRRTSRPSAAAAVRRFVAGQAQLWGRVLDDLEPWRSEGPLRWNGGRLEGAVLTEARAESGP